MSSSCGARGNVCTACAPSEVCQLGVCTATLQAAPQDGGPVTLAPDAGHPTCHPVNCGGCCDAKGICQPGITLTACGAGGAACVGCGASMTCAQGSCTPSSGPPPHRSLFITRTAWPGDLGGLTGADAKCQLAASAAGLTGTFKAWLSDANTDALSRMSEGGAWYSVGSKELVFKSRANLAGYPLTRIEEDEYGVVNGNHYWTGTAVNGVRLDYHCTSWTSDYGTGVEGHGYYPHSEAWTDNGSLNCGFARSLLCLQQ